MSKDKKLFFLGTLFTSWKYTYTSWLFYKPTTKKEINIHPTSPNPSWELSNYMHFKILPLMMIDALTKI